MAAHLLNAKPEQIFLRDGIIHALGEKEQTATLRDLADIAYGEPESLPDGMDAGLEIQYRYRPPPITMTSAEHACIVEVDADTGFVRIKSWVTREETGKPTHQTREESRLGKDVARKFHSR